MAEVIGTISAVIALVETSIKIYDSAQKDIKLSETFKVVRRRLPVILHILATCKGNLEPRKDSIPEDVGEALEQILDACEAKASNLRGIFEKIVPGENDTREKRYLKVLHRLGKGNKVEELMLGLTKDVQLIVNHDAVKSANQQQNARLEDTINEIKSVSSVPDEEDSTMSFSSGGGPQTNNINRGSGQQINNNGSVGTQNFVTHRQKDDFSFHKPAGVCLSEAPYIAPGLFVGRGSELDQIAELLHPVQGVQKQQRLILGGMGGIGKTRLAIAYAESRSGYYSSVFWLNAASEAALKDSFRSIATLIFDIQDPQLLESKDIIGRVHQWLSNSDNTRWLLLFDNYDDPDQFEINGYYPHTRCHRAVIVTTRWPDRVGGNILHVKPLQNIKDSLAVLQTRSKRENVQSDLHAKRLAERLAGLPLALATAGTYLQRSTISFERYLQEYERRWNIDSRSPTRLQEYRERTLYTTWDLSYARLETEDSDAAQLLKVLAYFGNQSLWHELFNDGLTKESPEWLRALVADDVSFQGVMGILTEYYFLEVHLASESWSMHNCVHDWTLAALNKNVDIRYYWYAFDCVHATINGVNIDSLGHITFSRSASHAIQLVHQRFLENDMIYHPAPDKLDQVLRVSQLLQGQIQLAAAEQMYIRALTGYEKSLGPDHTSTLVTIHNLGNLYCDQGKLDIAVQMYMRALARREKALGPDHMSTLITINNLGTLYTRSEEALGPDHTLTLSTVYNLGILYRDHGKLDMAVQMCMRALAGREKALGSDHISTLDTVLNLGTVYNHQGKLDEAEQTLMRALAGYKNMLGQDHTSTLSTVHNLGSLYCDQGKLEMAERMYMRALARREKALGPDHMSTLSTVHNLGNLYCDQGKLEMAERMYIRALARREKALGPDHTSTLSTIHNLGNLYCDQGKLEMAERIYIRALAGREKALGPDHTLTLSTVYNLGILYRDQGKLDMAVQMWMRALAGKEKALGPSHALILRTFHNLGALHSAQGELEKAEQMFMRALAGREEALGPEHTLTVDTAKCLGNLYLRQCRLSKAMAMLWRTGAWK
ncbi:hypothetical protein N7471_002436 [Penicillium samsonianum]|uniref:uncharacterized protein n=1 Tax=Penicillium samsonianum TaxID=1882272 RepID=UPI002549B89A|nr:uncharacterized protein N7471_002436 [Penicillium samsonianum]KAJ6142983.1 hypothetical protein N7471_002436 [Penicillium samsonianum]